jgi:hypothetical protein
MLRLIEDRLASGVDVKIIGKVEAKWDKIPWEKYPGKRLHVRAIIRDGRAPSSAARACVASSWTSAASSVSSSTTRRSSTRCAPSSRAIGREPMPARRKQSGREGVEERREAARRRS